VATAGDRIFAEPSTITGSIGVFGILPSFQGTLAKLGVGADGVKTTPLSGEPDLLKGPSPQAGQMIQLGVEGTYRRFLALVSEARHLPVERVNQIAQGRVWDGGTARQLGLVDQFGTLADAIAEAARRAHVDAKNAKPAWLEKAPSLTDTLIASLANKDEDDRGEARDAFSRLAMKPRLQLATALGDVERLVSGPAIQVRCLECAPAATMTAPRAAAGGFLAWLASFFAG
jgi:protease-4